MGPGARRPVIRLGRWSCPPNTSRGFRCHYGWVSRGRGPRPPSRVVASPGEAPRDNAVSPSARTLPWSGAAPAKAAAPYTAFPSAATLPWGQGEQPRRGACTRVVSLPRCDTLPVRSSRFGPSRKSSSHFCATAPFCCTHQAVPHSCATVGASAVSLDPTGGLRRHRYVRRTHHRRSPGANRPLGLEDVPWTGRNLRQIELGARAVRGWRSPR